MVATDGETGRGQDKQKQIYIIHGEHGTERPNVGGISIRSRNRAPSRKGCAVNGQTTKASNK